MHDANNPKYTVSKVVKGKLHANLSVCRTSVLNTPFIDTTMVCNSYLQKKCTLKVIYGL